jgi:hypothetical protein
MLENFQMMNLSGKITAFDYYKGIEKLTDNTGQKIPVRELSHSNSLLSYVWYRTSTLLYYGWFVSGGIFACSDVVAVETTVSGTFNQPNPGSSLSNVLLVHTLGSIYPLGGVRSRLVKGIIITFAKVAADLNFSIGSFIICSSHSMLASVSNGKRFLTGTGIRASKMDGRILSRMGHILNGSRKWKVKKRYGLNLFQTFSKPRWLPF